MAEFFAELKRRHIYRVAAAYAVLAWLLLQLVNNLASVLDLPIWVARALLLLLVVGFPVTLLIAWLLDLKSSLSPNGVEAKAPTTKLDYVLVGALILVIGLVSYQQLAPTTGTSTAQQATVVGSVAAPTTNGISVAVLPFVNLSGDATQEFFSDGMTEEITAALARVQGLTVLARTSAFEFKGQNRNIREIGQALNARYLIEGSVRKEGDRVRITAQLVQADNGANVWTESYDRQLSSVFATQEDIARAIADALRVPLRLQPGETLVYNRTDDLESYQQYLRALTLIRARSADEAVAILEQVVARDPNYAPAWALLPDAYDLAVAYSLALLGAGSIEEQRRAWQSTRDKMETAAREAIRLDPKLPGGYSGLALVEGDWVAADDLFRKALALDPGDPETLNNYSQRLGLLGYFKEALRLREHVRLLEPFVPNFAIGTVPYLYRAGEIEAAIRILEAGGPAAGEVGERRAVFLARAYAAAGRYNEAADKLLAVPADQNRTSPESAAVAARLLRQAPARASAPETLPVLDDELYFVYAHVGALDRIFESAERSIEIGMPLLALARLWDPVSAPLRKTVRFKTLVRGVGLDDYWHAKGWPDLCRPVRADDFECD